MAPTEYTRFEFIIKTLFYFADILRIGDRYEQKVIKR